jgi:transposase
METKWTKASLLPEKSGLTLRDVEAGDKGWVVRAEGAGSSICPVCGVKSSHRHSVYWRTFKDLPVQGVPVTLRVRLSRWRCRNTNCERKIFTERIPAVAAAHRQRTERLESIVQLVGHSMGGLPAERLMNRLGMAVSDDTILRRLKSTTRVPSKELRAVGIDDWAWKKGQNYGTILVDLESRTVADLLPERSAKQVVDWLKQNSKVEIVSRDRFGLYAQAAQQGAPQARQVADRFHLLLNLGEAVEHELSRQRRLLFYVTPSASAPQMNTGVSNRSIASRPNAERAAQYKDVLTERKAINKALFDTVHRLRQSGMNASQIVRETHLSRKRVDKWLRLAELPERNKMEPKMDSPAFFRDYLARRWSTGCHHVKTLLAELRTHGYTGCFSGLARFLSPWRNHEQVVAAKPDQPRGKNNIQTASVGHHVSSRVAAALLMKPRPFLSTSQAHKVDALKHSCPPFALMRTLVMQFRGILQAGKVETLEKWIGKAMNSGIYSMKRFAKTLRRDWDAVQNALKEPFSNGPVEGQINRLKTLKRQMYGRAGFDLLRARLLPQPLQTYQALHQT